MTLATMQGVAQQLESKELISCYGRIRAELAKKACCIVGYNNKEVLSKIEYSSLNTFFNKLDTVKQKDLYKSPRNSNQTLEGNEVSKYDTAITEIRRKLLIELLIYYPEKEFDIIKGLIPFVWEISQLTNECNDFNKSIESDNGTSYIEKHPHGLFIGKCANGKAQNGKPNNNESTNKSKWQLNTCGKSIFHAINVTFIVLFIIVIVLVILLFICYKNRKRIRIFLNKHLIRKQTVTENLNDNLTERGNSEKQSSSFQTTPTLQHMSTPRQNANSSLEPKTESVAVPIITQNEDYKAFSEDTGEWLIIGASVRGNGHISMGLPCQDSSNYKSLGNGWGIAVTSDGAGSAKRSEIGSAIAVQRAIFHFEKLIMDRNWIGKQMLPSEAEWIKLSFKVLKLIHDEIESFSIQKDVNFKDLSSTIIVVIHSPFGLLVCHIGDGRAGYQDSNGEWHSLITPHKGEEANQTIFIPSDFWKIPFYEMSGVTVPESRVITGKIKAFTLMSDGCESTSWKCNLFNEATNKYYDPNLPHKPFFDSIVNTLLTFNKENIPNEERKVKWASFITKGNDSFIKESDDKTMIVGALYK